MVEVMINGVHVPANQATVSVLDHGFLFGDMVYEVVKAKDGVFFALEPHLQRLRYSGSMIELPIPWTNSFLRGEMLAMIDLLGVSSSYLRLVITRGEGPLSLEPGRCESLNRILYGKEHVALDAAYYRDGVGVWVCEPMIRNKGNIKSSVYRNNVQAIKQARLEGFHEALLLDRNNMITECTTSNIFWVKGDILYTPSLNVGILKGVTRQLVIHLAGEKLMSLREGVFPLDALLGADEVFITSTTRDIMPVSRVGEVRFGVGSKTQELMASFANLGEIDLDWMSE